MKHETAVRRVGGKCHCEQHRLGCGCCVLCECNVEYVIVGNFVVSSSRCEANAVVISGM